MTADDEPRTLVCVRVADLPVPTIPSTATVCGRCLEPVWKSRRGWWWVGPVICVECMVTTGGDDPRAEAGPAPWVRDDLTDHPAITRAVHRLTRRTDA